MNWFDYFPLLNFAILVYVVVHLYLTHNGPPKDSNGK